MPLVNLTNQFAGQNWLITPQASLAVSGASPGKPLPVNPQPVSSQPNPLPGNPQPSNISSQEWLLTLTGVAIINLQGNNPNDWLRETWTIYPTDSIVAALTYAINKSGITSPAPNGGPGFDLELWAPFAAVSAAFEKNSGGVDAGFAVDDWRPTPFVPTLDYYRQPVTQPFAGIDVDVAVRNNNAWLYRVSYNITLLGRIFFLLPVS